jgi:hypothetical protein
MDVHPFIEELSRQLDETVDLSILDRDRVTFLGQIVAARRLRTISAVCESFPLHCSANGKALLAALPPAQQAQSLTRRLARLTAKTITNPMVLRRELTHIGLEGVAFDREEQTEGVCAVGAVLRVNEQLVAVSVPVPAQRFYGREREFAQALRAWVRMVNARSGIVVGSGSGSASGVSASGAARGDIAARGACASRGADGNGGTATRSVSQRKGCGHIGIVPLPHTSFGGVGAACADGQPGQDG